MKTVLKYFGFASSLMLLASSCNYLGDLTIQDEIGEERFWQKADAAAMAQYCNVYYPKLVEGFGDPLSWDAGKMFSRESQSDNIYAPGGNQIRSGQSTPGLTNGEWNWSTIRGCNAFLANYHKSPASSAEKERYAAEIRVFKAWDYFNKVKVFGDVPWYSKPLTTTDTDELMKARTPRGVVMDSVLVLLNTAIKNLPTKATTKVFRISKDAALALKARICLYEGTWRRYRDVEGWEKFMREAYDAAGELMKPQYGYTLYTDGGPNKSYFNLFIQDDYNSNPEIILSREYDAAINMGHNVSNNIPLSASGMSRPCFEEYLCSNTGLPISLCACHKPLKTAAKGFYIPEMKNRDMRLLQTLCIPEKGSAYSYYLYRADGGEVRGGAPNINGFLDAKPDRPFYGSSITGYAICKFFKASENGVGNHKGGTDAPVLRFAEVLLVRAEAGAELGLDPELDKTINVLRERVGFPFKLTEAPTEDPDMVAKYPVVKGPNANLIREIRRERRIELFAEGLRWDDVCRWNAGEILYKTEYVGSRMDPDLYSAAEISTINSRMGFDAQGFITTYKKLLTYNYRAFENKYYWYNIPINEVNLNPNLLPQNPGWE